VSIEIVMTTNAHSRSLRRGGTELNIWQIGTFSGAMTEKIRQNLLTENGLGHFSAAGRQFGEIGRRRGGILVAVG
jgi:hypothetical protein